MILEEGGGSLLRSYRVSPRTKETKIILSSFVFREEKPNMKKHNIQIKIFRQILNDNASQCANNHNTSEQVHKTIKKDFPFIKLHSIIKGKSFFITLKHLVKYFDFE